MWTNCYFSSDFLCNASFSCLQAKNPIWYLLFPELLHVPYYLRTHPYGLPFSTTIHYPFSPKGRKEKENSSVVIPRNYIISEANLLSGMRSPWKRPPTIRGEVIYWYMHLIHPKSRPISTCLPRESHANETMQVAYEFTGNVNIFSGRDGLIVSEKRY